MIESNCFNSQYPAHWAAAQFEGRAERTPATAPALSPTSSLSPTVAPPTVSSLSPTFSPHTAPALYPIFAPTAAPAL